MVGLIEGARADMTSRAQHMPGRMNRAHQCFERWRKSHRGRVPIPEALWNAAAEVAREHRVFRTTKVLLLDYNKLIQLTNGTVNNERRCTTRLPGLVGVLAGQLSVRRSA